MKTTPRYFISVFFLCGSVFFNFTSAQSEKTCGTDYMYEQRLKKDPSIAETRKALGTFTQEYIASHLNDKSSSNTLYIIPTVVHIIHNWGSENISDDQVKDAIRIANLDLQKLNADTAMVYPPFKPYIGNVKVELRLAQIDPDGNCTNGITRTVSLLTFNADDNVKQQLISWDNSKYLNIWVVAHISFNAGGYSYYPGTAPAGCEGVVVLHSQFGGIGTSCGNNFCRRTLTHELGHYFNLAHTWGSSNSCGDPNNCSIDDGVTDTPNTIGNCQTCNLSSSSCGPLENVENYMDYSTCSKMFTKGQAMVTDGAINSTVGGRFYLWQNSNLVATGTDGSILPPCIPTPYFLENTRMVCAGDSIKFTDMSWNAIVTSWNWNFAGGTPPSSSVQNPTVVYNLPGTYNVSLLAGTSSGNSTYTKTNYITVSANSAAYNNWQYFESFEQSPIPNADWIVNDTNGTAWHRTNAAEYTGAYCVSINNFNNTLSDIDQLISPSVDLSAISNPALYFRVAFAQVDASLDLLRIFVSVDCGRTWTLRYARYGAALATVPASSFPFVPTNSSHWRMDSIDLSIFSNYTNARFKFEFTAKGGNNIYLDDINISGPLGIEEENGGNYALTVFPNPSSATATVSFKLPSPEKISLRLKDVLGREVETILDKELNAGEQKIAFNTEKLSKGVYFVILSAGNTIITEKLLVQ